MEPFLGGLRGNITSTGCLKIYQGKNVYLLLNLSSALSLFFSLKKYGPIEFRLEDTIKIYKMYSVKLVRDYGERIGEYHIFVSSTSASRT